MTDNINEAPEYRESDAGVDPDAGLPPAANNVQKINICLLSDLAPARAYLDRIGARARNPWSASIVEQGKDYGFERVTIKLKRSRPDSDFDKIAISPRERRGAFKPTEEEKRAIFAAAKKVRWPELAYITAVGPDAPRDILDSQSEHRFLFKDPAHDNGFAYVQIYHPGVAGRGKYSSWICMTNGEWVFGQPDVLPLYGADQLSTETYRVFIHEGPKAAFRTAQKTSSSSAYRLEHPWVEELQGVHLGWPGGGNLHYRVDWKQLDVVPRNAEIIVVEDNDATGREAAKHISERHLHELGFTNVWVLRFPKSYAEGFDLGDEWPENPPALRSIMMPARYVGEYGATEKSPIVEEIAQRIGEAGEVFHYGGSACTVREYESAVAYDPDDPETDLRKKRKATILRTIAAKENGLILEPAVERTSRWQAWDGRREEMVDKGVPSWLLQRLSIHSHLFPPLMGVVGHPVLSEGKLLSGDLGYDRASRLYIKCPEVRARNWDSAKDALRFLEEDFLGRFPFATRGDRLRAILLMLTLLLRKTEIRGGAPVAFVTSPDALTGKSLLARALCFSILGRLPPPTAFSTNDEEFRKSFLGALMESPSVIYYDNMPNGWHIGGPILDAYATTDEVTDRILGKSEQVTVSALSLLIFAGNNVEPKDEFSTRVLEVRLERDGPENPDLKKALEFARQNRGDILGALETIADVARREGGTLLSRFPDWEEKVARPLMAVAEANDLLDAMAGAREAVGGSGEPMVADILEAIARLQVSKGDGYDLRATDLFEDEAVKAAIEARMPDGKTLSRAQDVPAQLKKIRDRQASGLRLRISEKRDEKTRRNVAIYKVEGDASHLKDTCALPPM